MSMDSEKSTELNPIEVLKKEVSDNQSLAITFFAITPAFFAIGLSNPVFMFSALPFLAVALVYFSKAANAQKELKRLTAENPETNGSKGSDEEYKPTQ